MGRIVAFIYGLVAYVLFFATFLYAIAFVGNLVVSESIDIGKTAPFAQALLIWDRPRLLQSFVMRSLRLRMQPGLLVRL